MRVNQAGESVYLERYRRVRDDQVAAELARLISLRAPPAHLRGVRYSWLLVQQLLKRSLKYHLPPGTVQLLHEQLDPSWSARLRLPPTGIWIDLEEPLEGLNRLTGEFVSLRSVFFVRVAGDEQATVAAEKELGDRAPIVPAERAWTGDLWSLSVLDDSEGLSEFVELRFNERTRQWSYPSWHECDRCIKEPSLAKGSEPILIECEDCLATGYYWSTWIGTALALFGGAFRETVSVTKHEVSSSRERTRKAQGGASPTRPRRPAGVIVVNVSLREVRPSSPPPPPPGEGSHTEDDEAAEAAEGTRVSWVKDARGKGVLVDDKREFPASSRVLHLYDAAGQRTRWRPGPDGGPRTVTVGAFTRNVRMRSDRARRATGTPQEQQQ